MIQTGDTVSDFELPGSDGSEISRYRLSEYTDDGPVIVSFYLFDFHPECTEHMCSMRDLAWFEFTPNVDVFAISTDKAFSHQAFANENGLDFALLADSDGTVSESFGVLYDEFKGHKRVARRSLFVVDEDMTVRYVWVSDAPDDQPDLGEAQAALTELAV